MKWILRDLRDYWEGYLATALVLLALLMAINAAGCNQMADRPWPHQPTPDHWLENVWMSESEYRAKRQWERENPPENLADRLTR